jgi:hypothetical protein
VPAATDGAVFLWAARVRRSRVRAGDGDAARGDRGSGPGTKGGTRHERWAYLRHSIVGRLLAAPPAAGKPGEEL